MAGKKKVTSARIISNKKITSFHRVMKVESSFLAASSRPGQFINIKPAEKGTVPLLRIPLGIHKINKKGISLLYKVVGEGTKILSERKKGERISILGPLGKGFDLDRIEEKVIIVSGGHGIAPLFALSEEVIKKRKDVTFLLGSATKSHITCVKELKKLGAEVKIATDDGSSGKKGLVTCLLPGQIKGKVTIFACGPKPMLRAVSAISKKYKVNAQVSLDEYMACGIGACLGCAVRTKDGYKMVCKDGPVFDSREIEWPPAKMC